MDPLLPTSGRYVVAVSGGVDSMALLHMLAKSTQDNPNVSYVIAHLDHGIRDDSALDRRLVQGVSSGHSLPFVYHEAGLGADTSEASARRVRYDFLHNVRRSSDAHGIITAHHQDDALETAIINILRGSGRKGITALSSRPGMVRPLLHIPKNDLVAYAKDQGLVWREDSTNQDQNYLRNYVRKHIMPRFDQPARAQLWQIINSLGEINQRLDDQLANHLHLQSASGTIDRIWFNHLPHDVAREILATWLRAHGVKDIDRKMLERLVVAAKVAPANRVFPIKTGTTMMINSDNLALSVVER